MNEMAKNFIGKFALPVLASLVIGIGSSIVACLVVTERMEWRVSSLEVQIAKHERALDRDFQWHEQIVASISMKTDEQEKQLTRLEALVSQTQLLLGEIRADVKDLLRGGK